MSALVNALLKAKWFERERERERERVAERFSTFAWFVTSVQQYNVKIYIQNFSNNVINKLAKQLNDDKKIHTPHLSHTSLNIHE